MQKTSRKNIRKLLNIVCASTLAYGLLINTQNIEIKAEGEETTVVTTYYNPYYGGYSNCTWTAWQLVYEATGIALPSWGNAGQWYANAAASGYTVSSEPRANSIGVWSGHVVYVTDFDGTNIYIKEGGFLGGYNECWFDGYSARYGESLIGYIYLDGEMSEISAPTYSEQLASLPTADDSVEMAIDPSITDQTIENLEEDVIKKYDPELVEAKKAEEERALKDIQTEEYETSTITTSTNSNTLQLASSILAPLLSKKTNNN